MINPLNQSGLKYRSYIDRVRNMYQKPVAQTSTALILTLLTISFFGFAAIRPTLATVSQLVGELEEKNLINQKLTIKLEALSDAQEVYFRSTDTLAAFDRAIPSNIQLDNFLLTLELLATQSSINLASLRLDPVIIVGQPEFAVSGEEDDEVVDPFPSYSVRFTADGSFLDLQDFLHTISNLDRVYQIQSVSFNQSDDPELLGQISMTVDLKVFWEAPSPSTVQSSEPANGS